MKSNGLPKSSYTAVSVDQVHLSLLSVASNAVTGPLTQFQLVGVCWWILFLGQSNEAHVETLHVDLRLNDVVSFATPMH